MCDHDVSKLVQQLPGNYQIQCSVADATMRMALEFHHRLEIYTRSVCKGRREPANGFEKGLINQEHSRLLKEMLQRAKSIGVSEPFLKTALSIAEVAEYQQHADETRSLPYRIA